MAELDKEALRKRVVFTLTAEPEDMPVEGNASAWGTDDDQKYWRSIRKRMNLGHEWAWCIAHVQASLDGTELTGDAYLGGCSYKNAAEFKQPGGYYEDMCDEALDDLAAKLEKLGEVFV